MRLTRKDLLGYFEMSLGVILVSLGFYFFMSPLQLVTGGVMGLSIIFHNLFGFSEAIFLYIANTIMLFVGLIFLGKDFFFKTIYATILSPTIVAILELCGVKNTLIINEITETSPLLVGAICATIMSGIGLGIVIKHGSSTGGMDVLQKIISKYFKIPFSVAMYVTDGIIILLGFSFGIERIIFALAVLIASGYLVDLYAVGGLAKRAVYIVTEKAVEIKKAIYEEINRGVTIIEAKGCFSLTEKKMLICILSRNQLYRIRSVVESIDENSFFYITKANEVIGRGFTKEQKKWGDYYDKEE